MSRSGYTDDCDDIGLWRGAVASAIKGKRGQALLMALRDALDSMPVKELGGGSFKSIEGSYCTLGVLGEKRGIDLFAMERAADYGNYKVIGEAFNSSCALVQEIMWMNDEVGWWRDETSADRWIRMRNWLDKNISGENSCDR